jgi:hypothetical protein
MTHDCACAIRRIGGHCSFQGMIRAQSAAFGVATADSRGLFHSCADFLRRFALPLPHDQQFLVTKYLASVGTQASRLTARRADGSSNGQQGWRNAAAPLEPRRLVICWWTLMARTRAPGLHCGKISQKSTKRIICFLGHILLRRT